MTDLLHLAFAAANFVFAFAPLALAPAAFLPLLDLAALEDLR
ncbi:hypothetical protein SAMN02745121_04156 [Nannocystis exedens]|uniref:Uncharacterized protein n=1 Tax=Nannocystis exedens TaxID=54 RepID=A0A1I2AA24_9BACT|nr:hypothetical protein [Nannocystis exedens]PCC69731.1 hypothetical protein NAEX_02756 [Nannocystis exedens]SFE40915.1 hypothetical protein SAMN02745121_04156 [Nannocystis exedens]